MGKKHPKVTCGACSTSQKSGRHGRTTCINCQAVLPAPPAIENEKGNDNANAKVPPADNGKARFLIFYRNQCRRQLEQPLFVDM